MTETWLISVRGYMGLVLIAHFLIWKISFLGSISFFGNRFPCAELDLD